MVVVAVGAVMVVVVGSATVPLKLTVALPSGANTTVTIRAKEEAIKEMGITKEMMENTLVFADPTGKVSLMASVREL